jgi:hypothetical protein
MQALPSADALKHRFVSLVVAQMTHSVFSGRTFFTDFGGAATLTTFLRSCFGFVVVFALVKRPLVSRTGLFLVFVEATACGGASSRVMGLRDEPVRASSAPRL